MVPDQKITEISESTTMLQHTQDSMTVKVCHIVLGLKT